MENFRTEHSKKITYDKLTGLLEKEYVEGLIKEFMEKTSSQCGNMYLIDIDDLQSINEKFGREHGDKIIKSVSNIIKEVFSKFTIITRISGDRFMVFTRHTNNREESICYSQMVCEKVKKISEENTITVSIGLASYPKDGKNYEELYKNSIEALRIRKNNGKNGFYEYSYIFGTEDENMNSCNGRECNLEKFGFEITETAFNIMEEAKDVDSAINLILEKVCQYYDYDVISVREVYKTPRSLKYIYEYIQDGRVIKKDKVVKYTKSQWDDYMAKFINGMYLFNLDDGVEFKDPNIEGDVEVPKTYIEIPIFSRGKFNGSVNFLSFNQTKRPSKTVVSTMKMFVRLLSSYLLSMRDYDDTAHLAEMLKEHDSLTGLYKYDTFLKEIKREIERLKDGECIGLVYMDIKNFRYINDTYGFRVGDDMLRSYSRFVTGEMDGFICGTRIYSDNIIIGVRLNNNITREENLVMFKKSLLKLSKNLKKSFMNRKITICAGMYIIEKNDEDADLCVSNANLARKEAKKSENKNFIVFTREIREQIDYKIKLTSELPRAFEEKEIKVFYQPKIESGTSKIVGAEALVRWQKPDGSFIYPDQFIPVFEENGMVIELDYYVYEEVFSYIKRRIESEKSYVPISLNVSIVHLQDEGFLSYIDQLFKKYEIPTKAIEFELTESIYIKNFDNALKFIRKMHDMGIKIAMDDFGSGYSSLNMLNNLPIDILKIDKVFLGENNKELEDSQKIIIRTIVEMATKLNMRVVCEGVENYEQNEFLTQVGCDMIQGYYYSKPIGEEDFSLFMEEHIKVEYKSIIFPFDGDMYDTLKKERVYYVGEELKYCKGPFEGTMAIKLPGGPVGINLIDVPVNIYTNTSYSVSCWAKIDKVSMWSSLFCTVFENGFNSIIPYGGDLRSDFRIVDRGSETPWFDTGSSISIDDGWHFYVATYNSYTGVAAFYIDDTIAGYRADVPMISLPSRCTIGGDTFQNSIRGAVAKFSVYNQAISRTDVVDIYTIK